MKSLRTLFGLPSQDDEPALDFGPEAELTEDDLRPTPLHGASVDGAAIATERNVQKLRDRSAAIRAELDRLADELRRNETVLKSQEAALAVLGGPTSLADSTAALTASVSPADALDRAEAMQAEREQAEEPVI